MIINHEYRSSEDPLNVPIHAKTQHTLQKKIIYRLCAYWQGKPCMGPATPLAATPMVNSANLNPKAYHNLEEAAIEVDFQKFD